MHEPIARWNRARGVWTTSTQNIVCGHSEPYSQTWPTSGTTRHGTAYQHRPSAHRTNGSACSSPPGLLPTPTARPYGTHQSASSGAAVRPSLDRLTPTLLPTPEAKLGTSGPDYARTRRRHSGGDDLTTVVHGRLLPTPRASDGPKGGPNQRNSDGTPTLSSAVMLLPTPEASDATGGRMSTELGGTTPVGQQTVGDAGHRVVAWGDYEPAIRRWEHILGRLAPPPTEPGRTGAPRLSPRFVEWMQGLPDGHVTDVPGLTRADMLTLLGNGVVPLQAAAATPVLLDMGRTTREATE